ncbi:uncharacterized protein LOC125551578 isoform X5 [Triticum urartu]|uniref:uncharacterized protein LOC125551578 isoform X5 n=1 Tax=Triticum urartu TaxID=4572 RepID=UPI0020436A7F|nr:uncharacterized protein LOC125551578 isoform X5 [Triticum urartu]
MEGAGGPVVADLRQDIAAACERRITQDRAHTMATYAFSDAVLSARSLARRAQRRAPRNAPPPTSFLFRSDSVQEFPSLSAFMFRIALQHHCSPEALWNVLLLCV